MFVKSYLVGRLNSVLFVTFASGEAYYTVCTSCGTDFVFLLSYTAGYDDSTLVSVVSPLHPYLC